MSAEPIEAFPCDPVRFPSEANRNAVRALQLGLLVTPGERR